MSQGGQEMKNWQSDWEIVTVIMGDGTRKYLAGRDLGDLTEDRRRAYPWPPAMARHLARHLAGQYPESTAEPAQ